MTYYIAAILIGLIVLAWSAERFIDGASQTSKHFGMNPLLIGMVIVGFGTSTPEMLVSAIAAFEGSPAIAFGNAYGSNITNIALILGLTALISPLSVHSKILRKELPILAGITLLSILLIWNLHFSRIEATILLIVFGGFIFWTLREEKHSPRDAITADIEKELQEHKKQSLKASVIWLIIGLLLLIVSSRFLVWGSIGLAKLLGISDLLIGLTIVAVGTSLPELASSISAARKGEHDIALGNIIGSNIFNTLFVVGIAGIIRPMTLSLEILSRDSVMMGIVTLSLFILGYGLRGKGSINRWEGAALLTSYAAYITILIYDA